MNEATTETGFLAAAVLCSGLAAIFDVRSRRIPNLLTGPTLLLALLAHIIFGGWSGLGSALLAGGIGFAATLVFFLMGGMGAGDVKLMAAAGSLLGLSSLAPAMLATALFGALSGIALALYRGRLREVAVNAVELVGHHRTAGLVPHPEINVRSQTGMRIPFAVPIALGCLTALALQLWRG